MRNNTSHVLKLIILITILFISLIGSFKIVQIFLPNVAEPAETYDCDDATLDMYQHFKKLGVESIPIVGNLDLRDEAFTQSNHVWLLVKFGEEQIAYDWGKPRFDNQHYEGYEISLDYLEYAVQQDEGSPDLLLIANYDKTK